MPKQWEGMNQKKEIRGWEEQSSNILKKEKSGSSSSWKERRVASFADKEKRC